MTRGRRASRSPRKRVSVWTVFYTDTGRLALSNGISGPCFTSRAAARDHVNRVALLGPIRIVRLVEHS